MNKIEFINANKSNEIGIKFICLKYIKKKIISKDKAIVKKEIKTGSLDETSSL